MTAETVDTTRSRLTDGQRQRLLGLARESIRHGLRHKAPLAVDPQLRRGPLADTRASFVSARIGSELNGCIGTLEARRPLVDDVVDNAFKAAFRDPRFGPMTASQLDEAHLEVSVLSPLSPLQVESEQELVERLEPGVDGLLLVCGARRGTLLPSVWEACDDPRRFVRLVKRKARLPADFWSERLCAFRYTVERFADSPSTSDDASCIDSSTT